MSALHLLRHDHVDRPGGDVVHLRATVDALRMHDVDAQAATWEKAEGQPDVVHLYNVDLPLALALDIGRARRRWPDAKVVISPIFWPWDVGALLRSGEPAIWYRAGRNALKTWGTWRSVRRSLAAVDGVVSCSRRERDLTQRYFRLGARPHWYAVPNGVWVDATPPPPTAEQRSVFLAANGIAGRPSLVIGMAGRVEPLKNQLALVEAVAAVDGAALLLIGSRRPTRYADRVFRRADRRLSGRWAWLGEQRAEDMPAVFSQLDVHVMPAFRDVANLVTLEAAAAGCEVVVSTTGAMAEYLGPLVRLAPSYSSAAIAAAIRSATAHPAQPELRAAVTRFDWSEAGRALADCYAAVLADR